MFISFLTLLFSEKFFGHITLAMISPLSFLVYVFIHDIYFDFFIIYYIILTMISSLIFFTIYELTWNLLWVFYYIFSKLSNTLRKSLILDILNCAWIDWLLKNVIIMQHEIVFGVIKALICLCLVYSTSSTALKILQVMPSSEKF